MSEKVNLCGFGSAGEIEKWEVVNDSVMGGLSTSSIVSNADGFASFSGSVSLENNGGFASIRFGGNLANLVGYRGFRISVQGDGKEYQFRAHTKSAERGHAFKHDFNPAVNDWATIDLPFNEFIASNHGRLMPEAGKVDPADISQVSFLIAGGQSGDFALKIRQIEVY